MARVRDAGDEDYRFEPEYEGLSNHLPMAAQALVRLGADAERLDAFRTAYSRRLTVLADELAEPPHELAKLLGARRDFSSLLALFTSEVAARGAAGAVHVWLPVLMPGVAAAAFHPLIMLYFALDAGNARGVAHALAYFAWSYLPLGSFDAPTAQLALGEATAQLARLRRGPGAGGLLYARLQGEAERAEVHEVLNALDARRAQRAAMGDLVIAAHQQVNDLLSLHMVTAFHAYERIAELLSCDEPADRVHLVRALLVSYLACGAPALNAPVQSSQPWSLLRERACNSPDEHVIKLVFTCHDLAQRWQLETKALAARAVRLA